MKISIASFTKNGEQMAKTIEELLAKEGNKVVHTFKPSPLREWTEEAFVCGAGIIFVGAAGICVRAIAPFIRDKKTDPFVVVVDELGRYVIPILSGHIGGGNEVALKIAAGINAVPVITTATDINKKVAVDVFAKKNNLAICDMNMAKVFSGAILEGEVGLYSDFPLENVPKDLVKDGGTGVCISLDEGKKPFPKTLNLVPRIITIGVGCKRNTPLATIESAIFSVLEGQKISIKAVAALNSIDLKKDEVGLILFCQKYNIPFNTFSGEELLSAPGEFSTSDFVKSVTGVECVCERSAVITGGELIVKKQASNGVTVALAKKKWSGDFEY